MKRWDWPFFVAACIPNNQPTSNPSQSVIELPNKPPSDQSQTLPLFLTVCDLAIHWCCWTCCIIMYQEPCPAPARLLNWLTEKACRIKLSSLVAWGWQMFCWGGRRVCGTQKKEFYILFLILKRSQCWDKFSLFRRSWRCGVKLLPFLTSVS